MHVIIIIPGEEDGWTVIQRRQDGRVDFYQNWDAYKDGFGETAGEYWLGLKYIHTMTTSKKYTLRIDLQDWDGNWLWAEYKHFAISDEADKYRLRVSGYRGNAGDSLTYHNNSAFSTYDNNNDRSDNEKCSEVSHGAWWYLSCYRSNLNGKYYQSGNYATDTNYGDGIVWQTVKTSNWYSMKSSIMKIRPRPSNV